MTGTKHDSKKPRLELISGGALLGIGYGMSLGAIKYTDYNWTEGLSVTRLLGACMRHLLAFELGEDIDAESGLPHLWLAGCELTMLTDTLLLHPELDDRNKWPAEALERLRVQLESAAETIEKKRQAVSGNEEPTGEFPALTEDLLDASIDTPNELAPRPLPVPPALAADKGSSALWADVTLAARQMESGVKSLIWDKGLLTVTFQNAAKYTGGLTKDRVAAIAEAFDVEATICEDTPWQERLPKAKAPMPVPAGSCTSFVPAKTEASLAPQNGGIALSPKAPRK